MPAKMPQTASAPTRIGRSRLSAPAETRQHRSPARHAAERGRGAELDLIPGVRDRLQARLAILGIPEDRAVSYVAMLTRRAVQSVRRWFDPNTPGLPDLESFARLCASLGCSADEMIGTTNEAGIASRRARRFAEVGDCIRAMAGALTQQQRLSVPMRVPGDEMAPHLLEGDLIFVDTGVDRLAGNGVYALECGGKLIIRRVEQRLGNGFVLKCDNQAYSDHEMKSAATARRLGVKVVGKVHGAISARVF